MRKRWLYDERQQKITAFYTDEEGRVRPITSRKEPFQELKERKKNIEERLREPTTTVQALKMIAERKIEVKGSKALQEEYERVNERYFKGRLPNATILLAYLPKVKHSAFSVPSLNLIVVNTAKSKNLEEQKASLRHEMIHLAGIKGHGTMFRMYAGIIDAPIAESPEGKPLYKEEYEELEARREAEREKAEVMRREQLYGAKKGEGTMIIRGKPAARVLSWIYPDGKLVMPKRSIHDERQIPKRAEKVELVLFDRIGYPKPKSILVDRKDVGKYYLVP